jgi:hypothetical protein
MAALIPGGHFAVSKLTSLVSDEHYPIFAW